MQLKPSSAHNLRNFPCLTRIKPINSKGSIFTTGNTSKQAHWPKYTKLLTKPLFCFNEERTVQTPLAVTMEKKWNIKISKGAPSPLGPSDNGDGINFAIFSKHASMIALCLFNENRELMAEVDLDPAHHKTGDVWHVLVKNIPKSGVCYGYKVCGEGGWDSGNRWETSIVLLDPYAPNVWGRKKFGVRDDHEAFTPGIGSQFLGTFDFESGSYDWGTDYKKPELHSKDLIIYELPLRTFTADESSGVPEGERGTFTGLIKKIPHLVKLGVNCVELLPVFEYDELEFQRKKNPRDHMVNIWGYSHISFFAPMSRFAANSGGSLSAANEFKDMVRSLHNAGIEVILDVVYNHTAESDDKDPYPITFRGIDNKTYYMVDTSAYEQLLNYSGCGNTINANNPVTTQLIVDSLRHWVEEYHVDGFRFDLASCLCRDEKGQPLPAPPLIRRISKDSVLKNVKLIAEPWDLGMYQVGEFPNWDIWAEWNGKYRDDVRRFIKGDPGMKKQFATRIAGSADLYQKNNRKPFHSINFVIAHDGFTLHDLVSYNEKNNRANGENNQDGTNDNFSWNCGAEGDTSDEHILSIRRRQMRNMIVALMMSQGTPMILAGDEFGHTRNGNNNWYGHDSKMTHFLWDQGQSASDLMEFTSGIVAFRKEHPALGQENFLNPGDVTWHESNWDDEESRFLAFTIHDHSGENGDLYCAFNAHNFPINCPLPSPPSGMKWCRVIDTNLPAPRDFTAGGNSGVGSVYEIQSYSSIVLLAKPN